DTLDDALGRPGDRAKLVQRLANYFAFAKGFALPCEEPFWIHPLPALESGLRIRLVGLNTAFLANDEHDHGALRLGNEQLRKAFNPPPGEGELVIVLSHHPLGGGWLADGPDALRWVKRYAHVHLSGHVHEASSQRLRSGGGTDYVEVVAG